MRGPLALALLLTSLGQLSLAETTAPGTHVSRPNQEPGMGDPAVLRVDGGGWRAQMSAAELDARVVEDVAGGLGIEVAMSGAAAERLRAVTVVGRGATMTIRICGVVIARPILWEPIETGRLAIMGAATTRMEAEAWVAALNGATPCPEP